MRVRSSAVRQPPSDAREGGVSSGERRLLILASFLSSERAIVAVVRQLDEDVDEIPRGINRLSASTFVAGVFLLVTFAWLNLE